MNDEPVRFLSDNSEIYFSRLVPRARSNSIENGLQAKVRDPLWFLTRQWQMGEFRASEGGRPVFADIESESFKIEKTGQGGSEIETVVESGMPLEASVERKADTLWDAERLEYRFDASGAGVALAAKEYRGGNLDWYDFTLLGVRAGQGSKEHHRLLPAHATLKGIPVGRWWQFEDGRFSPGDIRRPTLNVLSMLLIEFSLIYSNDWFVIPFEQEAGTVRLIKEVKVMDSFGTVQTITPIRDDSPDHTGWEVFSLSGARTPIGSSSAFFLPETVAHALTGELLEEIIFSRDEGANMVWAVERKYTQGDNIINRDDEEAAKKPAPPEPEDIPRYRLRSWLPLNWIPYIPMKKDGSGLFFRRGRTDEEATKESPQFKGVFLGESVFVNEEEIPVLPIALARRNKLVTYGQEEWDAVRQNGKWGLVRKLTKKTAAWTGRVRKIAPRQPSSGLQFDYVIEKKK